MFQVYTSIFQAVTDRNAEMIVSGQLNGGCNAPGSNSPGIGIATAGNLATQNLTESLPQWTLLDQDGDARTPQVGQYIGGSGLGDGTTGKGTVAIIVSIPSLAPNFQGKGYLNASDQATLADLAIGWTAVAAP